MILRDKWTGFIHNFRMDIDTVYMYIEKFHPSVQWYMLETKNSISNINFMLKNENGN